MKCYLCKTEATDDFLNKYGVQMRSFKIITLLILGLLQGCASNPDIGTMSSEQRAKMINMKVLDTGVSVPHEIIGQVKGISCQRNAYKAQILTSEEAIEGVKIRAALLDADAVINMACQKNSGTDWANNCWASIVCVGDAIKYK